MKDEQFYMIEFYGPLPAHKNEKMPKLRRDGRATLVTKPKTKQEMNALALQIPAEMRDLKLEHPRVEVKFWTPRSTFDRSNGWCAIEDLLWQYGVIVDDNVKYFNGIVTLHPAVISEEWRTEVWLYPK